jgi:hypothetical protein
MDKSIKQNPTSQSNSEKTSAINKEVPSIIEEVVTPIPKEVPKPNRKTSKQVVIQHKVVAKDYL